MNSIQKIVSQFEGKRVTTFEYDGRPCWIAREIGEAIGYADDGSRIVDRIKEWGDEMSEGRDYKTLTGTKLKEFKQLLELTPGCGVSSNAPHLMLLLEPGLHFVCIKTDKPIGKKLRRFLVDEVLPQLVRDGKYTPKFEIPTTLSEALHLAGDLAAENERLLGAKTQADNTIKRMEPYALAGEALTVGEGAVHIGTFAKAIRVCGRVIGRNNLFKFLRNKEILMPNNEPYQGHVDAGRFRLRQDRRKNGDGDWVPCFTTLITPKGERYVIHRMKNDPLFQGLSIGVDEHTDSFNISHLMH